MDVERNWGRNGVERVPPRSTPDAWPPPWLASNPSEVVQEDSLPAPVTPVPAPVPTPALPLPAAPDPPGEFLGRKTIAAADYLASVRAGAAHNAAVLARGSSTESRPRKASTEEPAPTFEEIA